MAPVELLEPVLVDDVVTDVIADMDDLVEDELLIEEISIDGMCGVY